MRGSSRSEHIYTPCVYGWVMSADVAPTFNPRTEEWIQRALSEYEKGLRRMLWEHPELVLSEYTGGD